MRRWMLILVLLAGCKMPVKDKVDPLFPDLPPAPAATTTTAPSGSNNGAPEPDWTSKAAPSPSTEAFRIASPVQPFNGEVKVLAPPSIAPGQELPVRVDWRTGQPTIVRQTIPDGVQLMKSDPPARLVGRNLEWNVPAGSGSVFALYQPAGVGRINLAAEIGSGSNTPVVAQGATTIGVLQLRLNMTGPATAGMGEAVNFEARVVNGGQVSAQRVVLRADLDTGLEHASGSRRVEIPFGSLAPGETKNILVPAVVRRSGSLAAAFSLQGESGATANESLHVDVREPRLAVSLEGPAKLMMNQSATWTVRVVNTGDAPATNINARVQLPPELKLDPRSKAAWPVGTLRPREEMTLPVTATVARPVSRTSLVASAVGDRIPEVRSDVTLEAAGVPMLKMTVHGADSIAEVGKNVVYTIEIKNTGSLPLRNVEVVASLPAFIAAKHGQGPTMATIDGTRVSFGRIAELDLNRSIIYRIEAEAVQPGDARISVEAHSETLPAAVHQDEATRIVGK